MPSGNGCNKSAAFTFKMTHMHFAVSAIGQKSDGHSCLNFLSAIKFAPAKNLDTKVGALPAARMIAIFLRKEQMEVRRGILATSSRSVLYLQT